MQKSDWAGKDGVIWWVGEVEDNRDPSQLGRVRVRIVGWYTGNLEKEAYTKEVPTETLPWATVLLPTDKPQTKAVGTTSELAVGSWVLGFFLDGESAQLPVVMGAYRGFQDKGDEKDKPTTIADGKTGVQHPTKAPAQQTMANQKDLGGASFPKTQSTTPADPQGNIEESRGAISTAEQILPGNAVTNPIKPPVEQQSIADGVGGPGGEGFKVDVERQLTELGNMAASLGSGKSGFVSLITGYSVAGDKVKEHLGKLINFISGGIAGILSPLKELLAKVVAEVINAAVKIVSQFLPMVVIRVILSLIDGIFDLFCADKPMWLGLVQGALTDTVNFANQIAGMVTSKIQEKLSKVESAVQGITSRILEGITNTMNRVKDIAGDVISAIETAKNLAGSLTEAGSTVQQIFSFDFTKLDWGSLIGFIMGILGMLFKKDCGRKIKRPKAKSWFPLIGSTECDNIGDAIKGTPYHKLDKVYKNNKSGAVGGFSGEKAGSYIDNLFTDIDPYLNQVQTFANGGKIINDGTPGKEKKIVSGPGGVSTFQDAYGNEHFNVPNNQTKIVGRDKCETIKGNYVLTVEGDFYLKVMGNFHEEVTGAHNEHDSSGPQSEASGSTKKPGEQTDGADWTSINDENSSDVAGFQSNYADDAGDANDGGGSLPANLMPMTTAQKRYTILKANNKGGFYPVDKIPYMDDADEFGRRPRGPQLSGKVKDKKEQKSANRKESDYEEAFAGKYAIQAQKIHFTGIEDVQINSQTVKIEGNTIEFQADGEIVQEANFVTSFLNAGRYEFIGMFNPFSGLTGSFRYVKGSIVDVCTDLPFNSGVPPTITRVCIGTQSPATINDVMTGTTSAVHNTFIAAAGGGVITEFVPNGSIVNQVVSGMASYSVGSGYMATGCGFGPHQVYGLPLLLN